ncbi:MAG: HpcH/HpaI aldolase/citrate lyase family protein [Panacagrimonas sp.]
MNKSFPIWRSMLFVPAHVRKFVDAAHRRGADAYLLDLEDSVPLAQKAEARAALASAVGLVSQSGAAALVRINTDEALTPDDVSAAVLPGVRALMVPKVESAAQVQALDTRITALEAERGIAPGHTLLIAQIEHVRAVPHLDEIASSSPRVMGMILGSEDFSVSAGSEPTPEALYGPNQQLVFACRRAGILPFGFPGSISVFRDLDLFRRLIQRAREMGFVGSYAIHPNQVQVMNELFAPPAEDVTHARELLAAYDEAAAQGRGALEFRGRMVDMPVVLRARELLRRADAVRAS